MSKRTITTTHDYLVNAPLPAATETYTVIPHGSIINKVRETLEGKGFEIIRELYRCNENAQVAQGVYHLNYGADPDLGMLFAWSNSYDKSMKFKCSIGGYVHQSLATVIAGNMSSFGRKHTGTADEEVYANIEEKILNAEAYFAQLVADKEVMKVTSVTEEARAGFIGRIYFINELLSSEQINMVKYEFKKPSYDYQVEKDSLWEMYNALVLCLQKSHPRIWMDQQQMVHYLLCKEFKVTDTVKAMQQSSNQLNLIDVIAEVENQEKEVQWPEQPDAVITVERDAVEEVLETVEIIPGLTLEEVTSKFPKTMENLEDTPHSPEVQNQEETKTVLTEESVDDGGWPCMSCGEMQSSNAIFYDGQLCSKCHDNN